MILPKQPTIQGGGGGGEMSSITDLITHGVELIDGDNVSDIFLGGRRKNRLACVSWAGKIEDEGNS